MVLKPCAVCGNKKSVYECPKCGKAYCETHVGSTDKFYCNRDSTKYTPEEARQNNERCTLALNSICFKCRSPLYISQSNGESFLKCSKCDWTSLEAEPPLKSDQRSTLIKAAIRRGYLRNDHICGSKLRKDPGAQYCPDCLIETLKRDPTVSFNTISSMFGMKVDAIPEILAKLLQEQKIQGFIEEKNKVFISITDTFFSELKQTLQSSGKLSLQEIADNMTLDIEYVKQIVLKLIRDEHFRGCFSQDFNTYYQETYLLKELISIISEKGRSPIQELADVFSIPFGNVKNYLVGLLKDKQLKAYFADNGNEIVTVDKLESEIRQYANKVGLFQLEDAATLFKVAVELVRRALASIVKKGHLRGLFTQKREFITEELLREKIISIVKAYRIMKLGELARRLAITEVTVEDALATMIANGNIGGYIDMGRREFVADAVQPAYKTPAPATKPAEGTPAAEGGEETAEAPKVEVVREYDFMGGQVHFKIAVRNFTDEAIIDVKVVLDVPTTFRVEQEVVTIPVIDPGNSRGVDFYLEPETCGISSIGATVIYKDAHGTPYTLHVAKKEVQIKCPLVIKTLDSIEDCQLAIQDLPSDARAFLISDLDTRLAFRAGFRAISTFDTRVVASHEGLEAGQYEAEAWFSSKAKVTGGRIIIRLLVSARNQSIEIRIWCNNAGQLTGLLAKAVELLFTEINLIR
ncbi:MAG TPA: PCI domain-containing protein, partial [Candidatus Lokiarchaeia archaeon]|nr:PCI domain-containing protein [Candidatus Lokiarchaeia archaeon]